MGSKPRRCDRLLHCTTRYAPDSISWPALLPHTGNYSFLIPACLPAAQKSHNTAVKKLATQENSQGYNKTAAIAAALDNFLVCAFDCLKVIWLMDANNAIRAKAFMLTQINGNKKDKQ